MLLKSKTSNRLYFMEYTCDTSQYNYKWILKQNMILFSNFTHKIYSYSNSDHCLCHSYYTFYQIKSSLSSFFLKHSYDKLKFRNREGMQVSHLEQMLKSTSGRKAGRAMTTRSAKKEKDSDTDSIQSQKVVSRSRSLRKKRVTINEDPDEESKDLTPIQSTKSRKRAPKVEHDNKEAMTQLQVKQSEDMFEYAFKRVKHPRLDAITEDSLMKCLNDFDIRLSQTNTNPNNPAGYAPTQQKLDFEKKVLQQMLKMASITDEEDDSSNLLVTKATFQQLYNKLKFKFDHEGRVL